VILTANQRLARTLRQISDQAAIVGGRGAWETARALPFSTWLRECWTEAVLAGVSPPRRLLNAAQEETIWRRIIAQSPEGESILDLRGTAESAMQAWRLLAQYRLPLDGRFLAHEDWAAFHGWAAAFQARCQTGGWLDEAHLPDAVRDAILARGIAVPPHVRLEGFDEFTPQQSEILDALVRAGCRCEQAAPEAADPSIVRRGCADALSELREAARWAARLRSFNPDAVIGIVLLNVPATRDRLEQIFDIDAHISMADPLADYPLVDTALRVLRLAGMTRWPIAECSRLLRSPYIGGGVTQASERALLGARLARARRAYVAPQLGLERLDSRHAALPSEWCAIFREQLERAGWPGEQVLSSTEYQVVQAWFGLLSTFATLDAAGGRLTYGAAVSRLADLAARTQFQPQDPGASVQVMGPLEAAGAKFDHLWISGADDQTWPAPAHPHPFLPLALQVERCLPHSSPEREFEFARRTFERLKASAPDIVVSWPLRSGDVELLPSPLLEGLPEGGFESAPVKPAATIELEQIVDESGPPVETRRPRGGTHVIRLQSACPFRAFADLRLGAWRSDPAELGSNPVERGRAVHKALELFWSEVRGHATMVAMRETDLQSVAERAAREAVRSVLGDARHDFDRRYAQIEAARIARLLIECAELEKARAPFTVAFSERERTIPIGGLELNGRIDRIDQLADGRQVIIDYKTSAPAPSAWDGERPDEPQLPLYAISNEAKVAAVAFAQAQTGGVKFKGSAAEDGILPGVRPPRDGTIEEQIERWRETLTELAEAFAAGRAELDPKRGAATCSECGLTSLCRIHEYREAAGEA
jgi:ATP-dependent helicase/nuclease subunit B